jgi:hypothetical protein
LIQTICGIYEDADFRAVTKRLSDDWRIARMVSQHRTRLDAMMQVLWSEPMKAQWEKYGNQRSSVFELFHGSN